MMTNRRYPFDLFDEMESMFDQMRSSMWGPRYGGEGEMGFELDTNVSVETTDDGYVVLADMPGFEKEEIDLRYAGDVLTIRATHEVHDEGFARSRHVHETVRVPGEVRAEDISASYRNGVLEVRLPADESAEDTHRIDVE